MTNKLVESVRGTLGLAEGNVPKVHGYTEFKRHAEDWAMNNTHHGKVNIKKHDAVLPNGKILRQTLSLGHANNGQSFMIGVFNHESKDSEKGHGWHHARDQGINEEVLDEGLWADKKKAWMATFENNVVSKDSKHQGKIDWNTAQYLHKKGHTPASASEEYLKAKGPKTRGVTTESFSDTVKKVGKNLAARPNKGAMPAAGRTKKMTEGGDPEKTKEPRQEFPTEAVSFKQLMKTTMRKLDPEAKYKIDYKAHEKSRDAYDSAVEASKIAYGVKKGTVDDEIALRKKTSRHMNQSDRYKKLAAGESPFKKEEVELDEGRVKELSMDLDDMHDTEFVKKYGKSKQEWRGMLSPPKPKKTPNQVLSKMYSDKIKEDKDADKDEREYGEPMGVPSGPGKSPYETYQGKKMSPKMQKKLALAASLGHVVNGVKEEVDYPTLDEEVELMEGPSLADMHPDNINSIIKQHGKQHLTYLHRGPKGEMTQHGLGFKELKSRLGVGVSVSVHRKFVNHLEKNGFKSSWSHTSNEWVAHPK